MYSNACITSNNVQKCLYHLSVILQQNGLAQRFPSPKGILSTRQFQQQNGRTRRSPSPKCILATRHYTSIAARALMTSWAIRVIANMRYKIPFTADLITHTGHTLNIHSHYTYFRSHWKQFIALKTYHMHIMK